MYASCIHCHAPLGANDALEHFPVGRRLAFDPAKGRLWVVCAGCRQWNLTPLEERWEAIDEGERLFRDTRLRASTDNIGLARLRDGTELVRIGAPQRPEFAAWRYGDRFARRWLLNAPVAAVGTAGASAIKFGLFNPLMQLGAVPALLLAGGVGLAGLVRRSRVIVRLRSPGEETVHLTQAHIETLRFVPDEDAEEGWHLRVKRPPPGRRGRYFREKHPEMVLRGPDAARVAAQLLPRLNRTGGRRGTVARAVEVLELYGDAAGVFRKASRYDVEWRNRSRFARLRDISTPDLEEGTQSAFLSAPTPVRLAAEMAAHEAQERAFLEGELDDLTDRWREAEEVAAIADSLTLPPAVITQLERLRLR